MNIIIHLNYTFSYRNGKGENITTTQSISDELLLGIGFGVYIYNDQNSLDELTESIHVDGNINLVIQTKNDNFMPSGWNLDKWILDPINQKSPQYRYIIKYKNIYANFDTSDFIQGIHTAFNWLESSKLHEFTKEIYDIQLKSKIIVQ